MKGSVLLFFLAALSVSVKAQQRIPPGEMAYFLNPKPNTIIYHDTIYTGRKQFAGLFYRTQNPTLIRLLEKHQSNKVSGQIIGIIGTIATIAGIRQLGASDGNKGTGWALIGGGFVSTLAGGYLTVMGQRNLSMAVALFNKQYHKASLGIGLANQQAGLVYQF